MVTESPVMKIQVPSQAQLQACKDPLNLILWPRDKSPHADELQHLLSQSLLRIATALRCLLERHFRMLMSNV